MKKTLAAFLLLCMALSLCAAPALAEEPAVSPASEAVQEQAAEIDAPASEFSEQGKAILGVTIYDGDSVGVLIAEVQPGGPADKAGLRPDDVLIAVNGEAVADSDTLLALSEMLEKGAPIEHTILRRGSLCTVTVVPDDSDEFGMTVYEGSAPEGPIVLELLPDGPADKAGIEEGDIIVGFDGQTIIFTEDLIYALQDYAPGDAVEIELLRDDGRHTVIAVLGEAAPEEPEEAFSEEEPAAEDSAAPVLLVTDLPLSVEVREGANAALLTVAAMGELDADVSFIWFKVGLDGITYPIDSFFLPQPQLLGLYVHNNYDELTGVYTSTLYADDIVSAAAGTYFCRVMDVNGAELDSSPAAVSVR